MKETVIIFIFLAFHFAGVLQEIPPVTEQQLENLTDTDQAETEDDSYLQQLIHFRKNPINLNTTDGGEFKELKFITVLQIENFLSYRRIFGKLLHIYELQAVPSWDVGTIKKILPYITLSSSVTFADDVRGRLNDGEHTLLLRFSQVLEKAKGYNPSATSYYLGGRQRLFFRYRYQYKNLLQYGVVGEKDAGEQFFRGKQKSGFDFYSFHFFARKMGALQALALGDFTVNLGQGLIQWQSLGFKKSVDVLGIKRQSTILRPYNSAGEFYFHRGAGITIKKGKIESSAFASLRKLSSNLGADTVNSEDFFSSFLTSGYHRTASEQGERNNLIQTSFGGNLSYKTSRWQIGVNGIYYKFSSPIQKRTEPYNFFAVNGKKWSNFSVDYAFTLKNFHFFGEAASDRNMHFAFLNGLLISVDPRVDLSFVQRTLNKEYQAINGNAFTENTYPTNETGWFGGISIRPTPAWRIDAYGDIYRFPWLKYLADAPSYGKDFFTQLTYTPNKQVELYTRFRNESKHTNQPDNNTTTDYLVLIARQNWRTQLIYKINTSTTLRNRVEIVWYDRRGPNTENGFMTYFDFIYKPLLKSYSGNLRMQYFETDYNSRIYAYENDMAYSYSIPFFFNKGLRYYINLNYDLAKKLSFWLKWSQTLYHDNVTIGSGLDEIKGNKKTELKVQVLWNIDQD